MQAKGKNMAEFWDIYDAERRLPENGTGAAIRSSKGNIILSYIYGYETARELF